MTQQPTCGQIAPGTWTSSFLPVCTRERGHADEWHYSQIKDGQRMTWRTIGLHGVHWGGWITPDGKR